MGSAKRFSRDTHKKDEGTLKRHITLRRAKIPQIFRGRNIPAGLAVICVLPLLAGCGSSNPPNERQLDQQLMNVTTSPIPGAQAKVLAAPPGTAATGAPANFCVTDAGYCPLAAAAPAGQNCLCTTGSLAYGGQTGAAPKTVPYTPPIKFLGTQSNAL